MRVAGDIPKLGGSRPGQHGLDADSFPRQLMLERVGEADDIRLGRAINSVQRLGRNADNGRDVDDGALAPGYKGGETAA